MFAIKIAVQSINFRRELATIVRVLVIVTAVTTVIVVDYIYSFISISISFIRPYLKRISSSYALQDQTCGECHSRALAGSVISHDFLANITMEFGIWLKHHRQIWKHEAKLSNLSVVFELHSLWCFLYITPLPCPN